MKNNMYRLVSGSAFLFITVAGFFLTIHDTIYTIPQAEDLNYAAAPALSIVLNFYTGMYTIVPLILFLLAIPWVTHYRTFEWKKERFDDQIALRKGKKHGFFQLLLDSIRQIWFYPVVINGILILLIMLFVKDFPLVTDSYDYFYFVKNLAGDVVVFTLLQIIGWSLLNLLCYMAAEYIRNAYLYPFVLLLVSLALTFVVSFLSGASSRVHWIFSALSPFELLAPGVIVLLSPPSIPARLATVALSFALYTVVFVILYRNMKKRRMYYG